MEWRDRERVETKGREGGCRGLGQQRNRLIKKKTLKVALRHVYKQWVWELAIIHGEERTNISMPSTATSISWINLHFTLLFLSASYYLSVGIIITPYDLISLSHSLIFSLRTAGYMGPSILVTLNNITNVKRLPQSSDKFSKNIYSRWTSSINMNIKI